MDKDAYFAMRRSDEETVSILAAIIEHVWDCSSQIAQRRRNARGLNALLKAIGYLEEAADCFDNNDIRMVNPVPFAKEYESTKKEQKP